VKRPLLVASVLLTLVSGVMAAGQLRPAAPARNPPQRDYPIRPVPFTAVHVDDNLWSRRIETNRTETIPFAFQMCERTGRIEQFVKAAKVLRGEPLEDRSPPRYPFDEMAVYKVIEGASYSLSVRPDPKLDAYLDGLIAKIGAAQEKDGYLYTTRTINPERPHPWAGSTRWELERVDSHELYGLGLLMEAAVAHHQATGKRSLLDVALKAADLVSKTFGPSRQSIWPGHQGPELALVRLYRAAGDPRYLDLSKFLLDQRGPVGEPPRGHEYTQSHMSVLDQTEAVGHAVRATYMYSGMADVAAMTGDTAYLRAINTIWDNVVGRKLYITGGIGAVGRGEAFGSNYDLPNMTAYTETCAAVGNIYWNHRMFLLHGDARYIDVLERTLYNGFLAGVSLDGKTFFYQNPLESAGQHERSPWFSVSCCPTNVVRLLASLPGYLYATEDKALYVNLFARGSAKLTVSGQQVQVSQETAYPWEGAVKLVISPDRPAAFALKVRVPGWAHNQAVPGALYRFVDDAAGSVPALAVNGRTTALKMDKGYAVIDRTWRPGDVVDLELRMPVRRVAADDRVTANRGRLALQRGPIVFAAEWPDNPNQRVRNLVVGADAPLRAEFRPDLLGGVSVLTGRADALAMDAEQRVRKVTQPFTAIPYYAWAHRGRGEMQVWMASEDRVATPLPFPTIATRSRVTTSASKAAIGINDGHEPSTSSDQALAFDWLPARGTTEWVEYEFPEPATVSAADVYWFEDRERVQLPASWRLLYRAGAEWRVVETTDAYGLERNRYNTVTFAPVRTTGLRLEVSARPSASAGILEWKVR
jgi:hypothetical protein